MTSGTGKPEAFSASTMHNLTNLVTVWTPRALGTSGERKWSCQFSALKTDLWCSMNIQIMPVFLQDVVALDWMTGLPSVRNRKRSLLLARRFWGHDDFPAWIKLPTPKTHLADVIVTKKQVLSDRQNGATNVHDSKLCVIRASSTSGSHIEEICLTTGLASLTGLRDLGTWGLSANRPSM